MKINCEKQILISALSNVSRVIAAKSSIQILEGVLMRAFDDELTLSGYDGEFGIKTKIPAEIESEGEVVLPARLLLDMIRKMSCESISIEVGESLGSTVKGGQAEFNINGLSADDFPQMPTVDTGNTLSFEQPVLKSMIEQTLFAVSGNDSKPVHTGSLFDLENGVLNIVSVDGYRLAMRSENVESTEKLSFVVPGKMLGEIVKMLSDDEGKSLNMKLSRRHIVFDIGGYTIISPLLEGEFLNYKLSIPDGYSSLVRVSTRELIECVERASLLISDRLRSPIRVKFTGGGIEVSCDTDIGRVHDKVDCHSEGEQVDMGFNNKYLLEALKSAGCDMVRIEISGPLSSIKILPPENQSFLFLVLPVRLK